MNVEQVIRLLVLLGPAVAQTAEFAARYRELIADSGPEDQAFLKDAYADLIAGNDEGHARLQEKLAAAAAR